MREAAENPFIVSDYTHGVTHCMRPFVLQDGHLVQRLPKGASIFLSMDLQRLLRRWEKRARMADLPANKTLEMIRNACLAITLS